MPPTLQRWSIACKTIEEHAAGSPLQPDLWDQYVRTTWSIHLANFTTRHDPHVNQSPWRWHLLLSGWKQTPASLISHHKPAFFVGLESFIIKNLDWNLLQSCRKGRFSQNHLVISMFNNLSKRTRYKSIDSLKRLQLDPKQSVHIHRLSRNKGFTISDSNLFGEHMNSKNTLKNTCLMNPRISQP